MEFSIKKKSNFKPWLNSLFRPIQPGKNTRVMFYSLFCLGALISNSGGALGQVTQLEHSSSSYSGTIPTGPSLSPVKARFVNNTSGNNFTTFNPEINVTAVFSDQQFTNSRGTTVKTGNFFGGTGNSGEGSSKSVIRQAVWRILNSISEPSNNLFTSNPTGTVGQGIDKDVNYGFNMFTSVEPLYEANANLSSRVYYSTLTLTFNRAVSNPVLHIVGLGGFTTVNHETQGYATELELTSPPSGVMLSKLSGNSALSVSNTKITNNKSTIDDKSYSGAASGSIRVTGNNITKLVFKVYLRGDGKGDKWSASNLFCGDQWLMAFSMNASSISGNVFDDGNALTDSKVNPIPTNNGLGTDADGSLVVNLVNSSGTIVASADVADDGGYVFQDVVSASYPVTYRLILTNSSTKTSPALPTGWINTGEFKGLPTVSGNDGTVDGIITSVTLTNATTIITNQNFGIEKIPTSDNKSAATQLNPGTTVQVVVPTLTGTDLEDGAYTGISKTNTIKIITLPVATTGFLYYDGTKVTAGQVITNYDPSKLKVDPTDGNQTMIFTYSHKDAALQFGTAATVTMPFYPGYLVKGSVYDDANGLSGDAKVNGTLVKGSDIDTPITGNQPVYVSLVNGSTIVSSVIVGDNGAYSFSNVPNGSYTVVLQTTGLTGSTSKSLPPGWVNTGENKGLPAVDGNDGIPADGKLAFTLSSANVENLNFGIDKVPVSDVKSANTTANPGGTVQVVVPTLTGKDLEDGTYTGVTKTNTIKIVTLPDVTTGYLYYNGSKATVGQVITNYDPSKLKVDPTDGSPIMTFTYSQKDAAGQFGDPATVTIPFAPVFMVSGNVYDDANGLSGDAKVNGTAVKGSDIDNQVAGNQPVYASLFNGTTIIATTIVADNGTYSFSNVPNGTTYTVILLTAGLDGSTTASLPANWVNTGENKGAPTVDGNDGIPANGKLSFSVAGANVVNLNLGIDKIPVSDDKTVVTQVNPGGSVQVVTPTLTGSDLEDLIYNGTSKTNSIKIVTLPAVATGFLYYDGTKATAGQVIANYDPAKLKVDPTDGNQTMVFTYSHKDAAAQFGVPATVTIPFYAGYIVSGNVFDDANGLEGDLKVNGIGVKGSDIDNNVVGTQPVFITISNGSSYSQTVQVAENGTYSFANVPADNYTVTLQTTGLTGSTIASLPANWVNTGEVQGLPTDDGDDQEVDGKLAFIVTNANMVNLNFGIDKIPVSLPKSLATQVNPGGTVNVVVPTLTGSDYEDGEYTGISKTDAVKIESLPAVATGILYYNGISVILGDVITAYDPALLTVDPTDGEQSMKFTYSHQDAAGQFSVPVEVLIPFTPVYTVTGNVFDDGNGLVGDAKVNGNAVNGLDIDSQLAGTQPLYVSLILEDDIVNTVPVNTAGTYTFTNVSAGNYTVVLHTAGLDGNINASLPVNWVNTGENNGLPTVDGNDGTVDGKIDFSVTNTNVDNLNYGINKIPVSDPKTELSQVNPGGIIQVTVPVLTGLDYEDGVYTGVTLTNTIKIVVVPTDAMGDLYYDGVKVTDGLIIENYDPAKLKVDPIDGAPTVLFTYSNKDAQGQFSEPALVTMPFSPTVYAVSGNVFDDANGLSGDLKVNGVAVKGSDIDSEVTGNQPVYVSLFDGTSVLSTVLVNDNGTYSFSNVLAGNYSVILQTTGLSGSINASLPINWFNTGENNGLPTDDGSDATVDGMLSFTLSNANVDNLNLGINKISKADVVNLAIPAPTADLILDGATGNIPALSGKDLEDGILGASGSVVVITTLPDHGQLYYKGALVTKVNIPLDNNFIPSQLTFKLSGTEYSQTTFEYAFVDKAGMTGIPATYTLIWTKPLPVKLAKFAATKVEQSVLISWATTEEANSERFDIQRSLDGKDWSIIGSVEAKGESTGLVNYSFTDVNPSSGENLYRLKSVDRDATFALSRIVNVIFDEKVETALYPNPTVDMVKIKVDGQSDVRKIKSVRIFNMNGQVVLDPQITSDEINVQKLNTGTYLMQITRTSGIVSTLKLNIQK